MSVRPPEPALGAPVAQCRSVTIAPPGPAYDAVGAPEPGDRVLVGGRLRRSARDAFGLTAQPRVGDAAVQAERLLLHDRAGCPAVMRPGAVVAARCAP